MAGYLLVAGIGAGAFANGDKKYQAVPANFAEPGLAAAWYFNVVWIDNFLGVPPILLGVLSFVGYLVLKRGFVDSFIGAIKTAIGVLLLQIGSSFLTGMVAPIFKGISQEVGTNVTSLDPYTGWSSGLKFLSESFGSNNYASWVSYTLLIGFALNIALVSLKRWTNCHAVMTTGHIMFQQSAVVVPFIYILFFRDFPLITGNAVAPDAMAGTIVFSGILVGTYWSTGTTASIKATNIITENANFAIGHQQMLGTTLAFKLGRYFSFTKKGQEVVSAESRKLSRKFRIFEDNVFVQSLLIAVLFLVLAIILQSIGTDTVTVTGSDGKETTIVGTKFTAIVAATGTYWPAAQLGTFWIVQVFIGALMVVAAILAIITGVRMFVTELQQSFQGISEKVIPGSVVAVDIAAVYGFSPNAVTYGFLSGVIGQYIGVGLVIGLSAIPGNSANVVVVPLFITLFFNSGAIGVYANVKGGWKAAVILPFIYGIIEIIVISFALGQIDQAFSAAKAAQNTGIVADSTSPVATGFNGMVDWNFFFGVPVIFAAMHPIAAYVIMPLYVVALLVMVQFIDTGMQGHLASPVQRLRMKLSKKKVAVAV